MPQIDISTFLSQAFWLIVCFCTLWGLLSVFITPKLADIIEQRKRKINEYLLKAEQSEQQAKEALETYNNKMSAIKSSTEQMLLDGKNAIASDIEQAEIKKTAALAKKIAKHENLLKKEEIAAKQQMENIAQNLALEIVHKLGFHKISKRDIQDRFERDILNG